MSLYLRIFIKKTNNNKKTNPVFPTSLILITISKFPVCNTYLFQEGKTSSHPIFIFFLLLLSLPFIFSGNIGSSKLFVAVVHLVMSDSLRPHGLQNTWLPCPSPSPRFAQSHIHWLDDANQSSHPLLYSSSPALNISQRQGLFQCICSLHQVAKVLEF